MVKSASCSCHIPNPAECSARLATPGHGYWHMRHGAPVTGIHASTLPVAPAQEFDDVGQLSVFAAEQDQ